VKARLLLLVVWYGILLAVLVTNSLTH